MPARGLLGSGEAGGGRVRECGEQPQRFGDGEAGEGERDGVDADVAEPGGRQDPARVRFCMAIVQLADGCLVGTVTLELDRYSAVYSHSIILRPGLANLAAGYETTQLVLAMAFDDLGSERFWCMAAEENTIANRLFLAGGGSHDGKIRHVYFRDGRWWDANMYAIVKDEWRARAHLTLREAPATLRRDEQGDRIPSPAAG